MSSQTATQQSPTLNEQLSELGESINETYQEVRGEVVPILRSSEASLDLRFGNTPTVDGVTEYLHHIGALTHAREILQLSGETGTITIRLEDPEGNPVRDIAVNPFDESWREGLVNGLIDRGLPLDLGGGGY